jgi:hypothetical protein
MAVITDDPVAAVIAGQPDLALNAVWGDEVDGVRLILLFEYLRPDKSP